MIKPKRLHEGDKVAIVSLSSGVLGEPFAAHELSLGIARLKEFGLVPELMKNSLAGIDYLKNHPEARAQDLKQAFCDKDVKAIICAIGGNDTVLTIPYLLGDAEFEKCVKENPKIFLGYSDSTTNHLMFQALGMETFYGMALLTDLAEFEDDMLPYSKKSFEYLFNAKKNHKILSAQTWYKDRKDFSPAAVGTKRESVKEQNGYLSLGANTTGRGILIGGCIDSLGALMFKIRENDDIDLSKIDEITKKYDFLPKKEDFDGKILLLETSDGKMSPETYRKIIEAFKKFGAFENLSGLIVGKPIDEVYFDEYKKILMEELESYNFPVLYNINIGHAYPHTILPLGALAEVDGKNKTLTILETPFDD